MRHYLSDAKCAAAVGGEARLRQLMKQPGATSATVDATRLESAKANTTGEIRTAIGRDWDIDSFDALWFNMPINGRAAPSVPMTDEDKTTVEVYAKSIFCYWAWKEGSENQAIPQNVIDDRESAKEGLAAIGKRLSGWGSERRPASARNYSHAQPLTVGHSPAGSHRAAFKGFT